MKLQYRALVASLLLTIGSSAIAAGPTPNPFLSDGEIRISHWNSAQQSSTEISLPKGYYEIKESEIERVKTGPINLAVLSQNGEYPNGERIIWSISTTRLNKVLVSDGKFEVIASTQLPNRPEITNEEVDQFIEDIDNLFGFWKIRKYLTFDSTVDITHGERYMAGAAYAMMSKEGSIFLSNGKKLLVYEELDPTDPYSKIVLKRQIDIEKFVDFDKLDMIMGMNMTYTGEVVLTIRSGKIVILDRFFRNSPIVKDFNAQIDNAVATDETGIYLVTSEKMHKLVYNSEKRELYTDSHGAWSEDYDNDGSGLLDISAGSGTTPTIMMAGEDKLVIINDNADKMKLIAYWADEIPADAKKLRWFRSKRYAGEIELDFGLGDDVPIKSESSILVKGNYAFMMNNALSGTKTGPMTVLEHALSVGPEFEQPYGVALFAWNNVTNEWNQKWTRPDVSSPTVVPMLTGNMAFVHNFFDGRWQLEGIDLETGKTDAIYRFPDSHKYNAAWSWLFAFEKDGETRPLIPGLGGVFTFSLN